MRLVGGLAAGWLPAGYRLATGWLKGLLAGWLADAAHVHCPLLGLRCCRATWYKTVPSARPPLLPVAPSTTSSRCPSRRAHLFLSSSVAVDPVRERPTPSPHLAQIPLHRHIITHPASLRVSAVHVAAQTSRRPGAWEPDTQAATPLPCSPSAIVICRTRSKGRCRTPLTARTREGTSTDDGFRTSRSLQQCRFYRLSASVLLLSHRWPASVFRALPHPSLAILLKSAPVFPLGPH